MKVSHPNERQDQMGRDVTLHCDFLGKKKKKNKNEKQ